MLGGPNSLSPLGRRPDTVSHIPDDTNWLTPPTSEWPSFNHPVTPSELGLNPDPFFTIGWPEGSIFKDFREEDAERERQRRKTKIATNTSYFARARHFREVQESRAFTPPNAFYELLRRKALEAQDADRQARIEQAGRMFLVRAMGALRSHFIVWKELVKKNKRAKQFLLRKMFGIQRSVLLAWNETTSKHRRAKLFMARHMSDHQTKAFFAWKEYVKKNLKIKRMLQGHIAKLEERTFRAWSERIRRDKFVREKIAKHLVGARREKFKRWAKYAETSLKIKRLVGKHFVGIQRTVFVSWFIWTGKSIKAKRMFASHLMGLQKAVLQAWRRVADQWRRERIMQELWRGHQKPHDFFSVDNWGAPAHTVKHLPRSYSSTSAHWRMY